MELLGRITRARPSVRSSHAHELVHREPLFHGVLAGFPGVLFPIPASMDPLLLFPGMKPHRHLALLPLLVTACSTESPTGIATSDSVETFQIRDCSLGCAFDPATGMLACDTTVIGPMDDITVTFNAPIDPASISFQTVAFRNEATGVTVPMAISLRDPATRARRFMITFDSSGNPIFGVAEDETYVFHIPGLDAGITLRDISGRPNTTPLTCLLRGGPFDDAVPGPPTVTVFAQAQEVDPDTGEVVLTTVLADGATSISPNSPILFEFDDIMNPATLANVVQNTTDAISVFAEQPDAPGGRIEIEGRAYLVIDQDAGQTVVSFLPDAPLPACQPHLPCPKVVIEFEERIADFAGNLLTNPFDIRFRVGPRP